MFFIYSNMAKTGSAIGDTKDMQQGNIQYGFSDLINFSELVSEGSQHLLCELENEVLKGYQ